MADRRQLPLAILAIVAAAMALVWLAVPRLPPHLRPSGPDSNAGWHGDSRASPIEPSVPARQHASTEARLRGRCVDDLDGRPLAALSIRLGELQATTDLDGRFELPRRGPGPFELRIAGGNVVPGVRRFDVHDDDRAGTSDLELGELRLRTGARLSGWLLDATQQPVPNTALVVPRAQRTDDAGLREDFATTTTTRADGAFHFPDPLPAGDLVLALRDSAEPLDDARCRLTAGVATQVTVRLAATERAAMVVGQLVDAEGRPLADTIVQGFADPERAGSAQAMATSDANGRFVLRRQASGTPPLWPLVRTEAGTAVPQRADGSRDAAMPWGSEQRFVVMPVVGPELVVVDAEDGTPIESFAWRWDAANVGLPRSSARGAAAHHPGGRCRLVGTGTPHTLVVWPQDPRWLPTWRHDVVAAAGATIPVALPRATDFVVALRTRTGRIVPTTRLELLTGRDPKVVHELSAGSGAPFGPHDTLRLASATSDGAGHASLRWWNDPEPRTLRLLGPGIAEDVTVGLAAAGTTGLELVVEDTGRVRFLLEGAAGSFVQLRKADGTIWPPRFAPPIQLDEHGEGRIVAPVGTYEVSLGRPDVDAVDGRTCTLASFATVTVRIDSDAEVEHDLRERLQPARCVAAVLVDGEAVPLRLWGRSGTTTDRHLTPSSFGNGRSHFDGLPAGSYRAFVRLDCGGQAVDWPLGDWTTIPAGASLQLGPFVLRTTTVELVLEDRSGAPIDDGLLMLRWPAGGACAARPDARGRVRLRGIPDAPGALTLRTSDDDRELGAFDPSTASANGPHRIVVE